jgi:hypothetical protein
LPLNACWRWLLTSLLEPMDEDGFYAIIKREEGNILYRWSWAIHPSGRRNPYRSEATKRGFAFTEQRAIKKAKAASRHLGDLKARPTGYSGSEYMFDLDDAELDEEFAKLQAELRRRGR